MKTKFHLAKRASSRYASGSSALPQGGGQAVALIDERYLGWLAQQQPSKPAHPLQRSALTVVFSGLARLCGAEGSLTRACLFTDQPPTELVDGVLLRMVPPHALDGGLGLVRSLGLELTQLASRGACSMVLIASDDERLIPYIDEAQWRGLKVVLVTDEASQDYGRLTGEDPSWARLLMQADRRVALHEAAWAALTTPGANSHMGRVHEGDREADSGFDMPPPDGPPSDEWRAQVERVIQEWWRDETPHARLDLYEEMQNSQGVPPETDRHLLLRVRRELARALSFPEKKAMREMIRETVLAQPPVVDETVDS
ncbi:hypothetical protein [Tepidicella baoligensis]|uniref:hypothetical protein n=1 Tax=Tepidicella baoligensis TaxID=2707016 RepID=UPI0015DACCED|nr:hypothetical protein [Tepidicella baoligensis]